MHLGFLRMQKSILLEKSESLGASLAPVFVLVKEGVSELQVGPNAPILVIELKSLARSRSRVRKALLIDVEPTQVGIRLVVGSQLDRLLKRGFCGGKRCRIVELHIFEPEITVTFRIVRGELDDPAVLRQSVLHPFL